MAYEFKYRRRVEFADTDMAGIAHFSAFFRYMEEAEHAFFRSLGFSVCPQSSEIEIGWPRAHVECDFKKVLRFEDVVEVHLLVRERRKKSIAYDFIFRKVAEAAAEQAGAEVAARGSITVVCTSQDDGGRMKAVPIPKEIADKIEAAPQELLA